MIREAILISLGIIVGIIALWVASKIYCFNNDKAWKEFVKMYDDGIENKWIKDLNKPKAK